MVRFFLGIVKCINCTSCVHLEFLTPGCYNISQDFCFCQDLCFGGSSVSKPVLFHRGPGRLLLQTENILASHKERVEGLPQPTDRLAVWASFINFDCSSIHATWQYLLRWLKINDWFVQLPITWQLSSYRWKPRQIKSWIQNSTLSSF